MQPQLYSHAPVGGQDLQQDLKNIVTLRGQQIERSVFRMYDDKVYTVLNINLKTYALTIEHGINSKISKRRFNVKEIG